MLFGRFTVAAAMLAACGSDPVPFTIQLDLDTSELHQCASENCSDFGMRCGAVLGVRIIEADSASDTSDGGAGAVVLAEACGLVADSETLCALDQISLPLANVRTGMVQIQVALWNPNDVALPTCPTAIFNLQGIPDDTSPQPAFGGSTYFDVGSESVARISLACRNPDLLDLQQCLPESSLVTARLIDMGTVVPIRPEVATLLNVSVGEPQLDTEADPPEWVIGPTDATALDLIQPVSDPPVWDRENAPEFDSRVCVLVALDVPQPVTSASCTDDLTLEDDGSLDLTGLQLPQTVLTDLLDAAGIVTFPSEGLVIGRVVDNFRAPLAGVTLTPDPPGASILYVNGSRDGVSATAPTSSSAYFISTDAPFDTRWLASDGAGRTQRTDIQFRAGLIVGKLSLVVVEMTENLTK